MILLAVIGVVVAVIATVFLDLLRLAMLARKRRM
jgi:hypothetical protein